MFKLRSLSLDAKEKTFKGKFRPSPTAERDFNRALKKVARVAGHIIESHTNGVKIDNEHDMQRTLREYARLIEPWAKRQSQKLLQTVQRSNKKAYQEKSKAIGKEISRQFLEPQTMTAEALIAHELHTEQVKLITSIPIDAGLRAQKLAQEAALHGARAQPDQSVIDDIKKQLGSSTEVAVNRATLIARTETAKANATINQARAMSVGSRQYRWHNSGDGAVRPSHRTYKGQRLQGKIFSWDDPPTLDDGMTGHPGEFPNCRCFAEPVFDEE